MDPYTATMNAIAAALNLLATPEGQKVLGKFDEVAGMAVDFIRHIHSHAPASPAAPAK